jgi:hypothetical protein
MDQQQRTADAAPPAPSQNPFDPNNLKADVHADERWTQFGAGVLASPQKAQAEAYAASKGVSLTPQVAGEWFKSTLPQDKASELDHQARNEYQVIQLVNARDQLATEAAKQFKLANPQGSDQEMYRYVHQNLLNAGKDNSKLPAFEIDPKTLEAKTDVGLIHGLANRSAAALLSFPTATAEAGARMIQEGVYQASKPFYDQNANPYQEAIRKQNEGIGRYNQAVDSNLQGSTYGKEHPTYGMVEEGVAQVPSLLLLSGLGKAGTVGKIAEWGQVAGTEFNKAYEHVYNDGLSKGMSAGEAGDKATLAGAIDAAINTYLMTKGTLGQQGGAGLRGRLRAALTGALPQGGVAAGQEFVRQMSSYALTGKDPNLEKVLDSGVSGTVTGGIAGAALGHPGSPGIEETKAAVAGTPGTTTVNGQVVPAPTPQTLAEVKTAPTPAPSAEVPKLVDSATPKFRKQVDGKSEGVNLAFASAEDKALYIATEPRQGKRSKAAREYLKGLGYDEDGITAYGEELRDRVGQAAVQHTGGDSLDIPGSTRPEGVRQEQSSGVNNAASQDVTAPKVTEAVAPASTKEGQADPSYLPARNRDTKAAIADATAEIPDFRQEAPANKEQAQAADAFRNHGVELVFYSGKGRGVRLSRHDGVLFINKKNVDSDLHEAVSHEFMHELKANRPGLFAEFLSAMPQEMVAKARAEYAAKFAKYHKGDSITPAKLDEEAVTYSFGQIVRDNPRAWKAALGQKAGLATKIMDAVREFAGKFVGGKIGANARLVAKAVKTFEATLNIPVGETAPREVREADTASYLPEANDDVRKQAEEYTKSAGIPYNPDSHYATVDNARAKRIAAAYDLAKHNPNEPSVKASYEAFKKETLAQYEYLKSKGIKFDPWGKDQQPYQSSAEMLKDVRDNKHLGFYQGGDMPADHPLAEKVAGTDLTYNDVFRAVHDYFGHAKEGVGFGPRGEENAWRSHSQMYSDLARGAMTAETRGQNSWVNFGPHGEHNQANPKETKYAEQKATLLPPEFSKVESPTPGIQKLDKVIEDLKAVVGKPDYLPDYKPRNEENRNNLEDIKTFLHPSEYESLSTPEVKRAVNLLGELPDDVAYEAASEAGRAKLGWYKQAGIAISSLFKNDTPKFVSLLAGDSPRQSVKKNLVESLKVWLAWDKAGRPTDPEDLRSMLESLSLGKTAEGKRATIMATRIPNLVRALSGPDGVPAELSGYKVSSFRDNLLGDLSKSTNDTWMAQFGGIPQDIFADNGGYLGYTAKVRRVASKLGIEPANVQETVWSFFKTLSEKINTNTTGQEALQNLRHEDVAAAPAFQDMLGEPDVRLALNKLGIGDAAIRRATKDAAAEAPPAPTGYVTEGSGGVLAGVAEKAEGTAKQQPAVSTKNQGRLDFLPGEKFIEDDVKPLVTGTAEAVSKAWDGVKSILAPYTRSSGASDVRGILRERGADLAQRWDRLDAAFADSKAAMDKLPEATTRDFIDKVEKGQKQSDPALQPIADALRGVLDDRLHQVQGLGTGKLKDFVENYFPHLWKDPTRAGKLYAELMAKRPVEGGKKFLKQRSHELFSDGIAAGLEPITENPVEAMMLRVREMDKYITAHQAFNEMRTKGLAVKVKAKDVGAWKAKGYGQINDNIATIFAKPSRRGAVQIQGYYMAPEPVANVVNNYLSPGLRGNAKFGKLFRGYVGASNLMNAVQLGLSGFHLAFTVMDSGISKMALGIEQAAAGQWKDAGKSAALSHRRRPRDRELQAGQSDHAGVVSPRHHHPGHRGRCAGDEGGGWTGEDGRLLPHRHGREDDGGVPQGQHDRRRDACSARRHREVQQVDSGRAGSPHQDGCVHGHGPARDGPEPRHEPRRTPLHHGQGVGQRGQPPGRDGLRQPVLEQSREGHGHGLRPFGRLESRYVPRTRRRHRGLRQGGLRPGHGQGSEVHPPHGIHVGHAGIHRDRRRRHQQTADRGHAQGIEGLVLPPHRPEGQAGSRCPSLPAHLHEGCLRVRHRHPYRRDGVQAFGLAEHAEAQDAPDAQHRPGDAVQRGLLRDEDSERG